MKRHPLLAWVVVLLVLVVRTDSKADDVPLPETVQAFLADYGRALESHNPFVLLPYDPTLKLLSRLAAHRWFDHVATTRVALSEVSLVPSEVEGEAVLSFVKTQEDVMHSGLFTRGLAQVRMRVRLSSGGLRLVSHLVEPPPGAPVGYRSDDPTSWGAEHPESERFLYQAIELLRDGDGPGAHDAVERAQTALQNLGPPTFLVGPGPMVGTLFYFAAMDQRNHGEPRLAQELLDTAMSYHPRFPVALNLRGDMAYREGQLDEALAMWKQSLELWGEQDDLRALVEVISEASITPDPKRRQLLLDVVDSASPYEVVQLLAPAVKKKPRDSLLVSLLATAHLLNRDPQKAQQVLQDSRRVGSEPSVTYLAARVQVLLGGFDKASDLFTDLLAQEPGYKDSLVWKVALNLAGGRDGAVVSLIQGLKPPVPPEFKGYAECLRGYRAFRAGRTIEARQHLVDAATHPLPMRLREAIAALLSTLRQSRR